jgi:putative molybdopterin biosynthesis protein
MAVRTGAADAGLGIRVAAERCGLEFVPIGTERFELAIPAQVLGHAQGAAFLAELLEAMDGAGRRHAPGYDLQTLGRVRAAPCRAA